jgi:hypothetical protein
MGEDGGKMTDAERIAELEEQVKRLQENGYTYREAIKQRDATIAGLRLQLGQTKYALSRAREAAR